jgi:hypothetical protein
LGLESWPPSARKVPILAYFEADLKKYTCFFWAGTNVYLDFRFLWSVKVAADMLTSGKWWPFEIYLTTTWTAPYFDHTYLGFPSIKSNGFFTKIKGKTKRTIKFVITWNFYKISNSSPKLFFKWPLDFFCSVPQYLDLLENKVFERSSFTACHLLSIF